MTDGSQIGRLKKTVGVMTLIVLALVVLRFGCNRVGFAEAVHKTVRKQKKVSLSPTIFKELVSEAMERGAGRSRPYNVDDGNLVSASSTFILRRFRVTAYCPGPCCCWPFADGITASGHQIKPGDALLAADKSIPFGTQISIPGYNDGLPVPVADRGGDIIGNRLDVLFYDGNLETSHATALEWGDPNLECKIYK